MNRLFTSFILLIALPLATTIAQREGGSTDTGRGRYDYSSVIRWFDSDGDGGVIRICGSVIRLIGEAVTAEIADCRCIGERAVRV